MMKLKSKIVNKNILKFKSTFSRANRGAFFQDEPKLTNQYKEDAYLREHLKLVIPAQVGFFLKLVKMNQI